MLSHAEGQKRARIAALAGGVGAARFLEGLVQVVEPTAVTAIVNTADDAEFYGLHVSPDVDIVLYTLAGLVNVDQGWGIQGDTFHTQAMLAGYGHETWFQLGDRDLATHIHRTDLLRRGASLTEVTADLRRGLGVPVNVLPMTDQRVRTRIRTPEGWLPFQEYFVKRRTADTVLATSFSGVEESRPAHGALEAMTEADVVLICPSNPLGSIGPILEVSGVRSTLRERAHCVVAISPIVGGTTLKGPADRMMRDLGFEASPVGVAEAYRDFLDVLVIDERDRELAPRVEAVGVRAVVTDTIMRDLLAKTGLARATLSAALGG